mmetsp:Transcript_108818/g.336113  ORF Transcript_108818/g.336113 Transcript_108818/m.336113 type:complete len:242 (+) Transcript_108818:268-993(+)
MRVPRRQHVSQTARWAGVAPATAGAAVAPLQRAPVGAAGPGWRRPSRRRRRSAPAAGAPPGPGPRRPWRGRRRPPGGAGRPSPGEDPRRAAAAAAVAPSAPPRRSSPPPRGPRCSRAVGRAAGAALQPAQHGPRRARHSSPRRRGGLTLPGGPRARAGARALRLRCCRSRSSRAQPGPPARPLLARQQTRRRDCPCPWRTSWQVYCRQHHRPLAPRCSIPWLARRRDQGRIAITLSGHTAI